MPTPRGTRRRDDCDGKLRTNDHPDGPRVVNKGRRSRRVGFPLRKKQRQVGVPDSLRVHGQIPTRRHHEGIPSEIPYRKLIEYYLQYDRSNPEAFDMYAFQEILGEPSEPHLTPDETHRMIKRVKSEKVFVGSVAGLAEFVHFQNESGGTRHPPSHPEETSQGTARTRRRRP